MTKTPASNGVSRLFLSVDLTGSTAFKQRDDLDSNMPWQKVFLQFYREYPEILKQTQQEDRLRQGGGHLQFQLRKAIGDELIFSCVVLAETDTYWALRIWLQAMRRFETQNLADAVLGVSHGPSLGVKGGAFLATFPGPDSGASIPRLPNSEDTGKDVIELNRQALAGDRDHARYLFDYFGPSIDTGFRVLARCNSRYFTLSLEVAYVLSCLAARKEPDSDNPLTPILLTSDGLKGVRHEQRYPLFALDLEQDDEVNKAFARFESPPPHINDILNLCEACYSQPDWPFHIYLPNAFTAQFRQAPTDPLAEYVSPSDSDVPPDDPPDKPNVKLETDAVLGADDYD